MGKRSSLLSRRKALDLPLRGGLTSLVEERLRNERQKRNVALRAAYFCKPSIAVVSETEWSPRNTEKKRSRFILGNEKMKYFTHKRWMKTERETKALERFRRLARIVRTIIRVRKALQSDPKHDLGEGIAKSFLELMERYIMIKNQSFNFYGNENPSGSNAPPLFDPSSFKANREVKTSKEVEKILGLNPEQRTPEQLHTVLYVLQTVASFSELPLRMQEATCKVAWLQSLPPNKIIVKQGHVGENFYFIISGSVTVMSENDPTKDNAFTSLATLRKGASFGDVALMNNCRRTATVVAKDLVQLVVINKEDYQNIFMGKSKSGEEPPHIRFCRTLAFISSWPIELLVGNTSHCRLQYFRRGTVIVKNSNISEWLYIIKTGVCDVIMNLEITKPKLTGKHMAGRRAISAVDKLEDLTEARYRKSKYSSKALKCRPAFYESQPGTAALVPRPPARHLSPVVSRNVTSATSDATYSLPIITSAGSSRKHRSPHSMSVSPDSVNEHKRSKTFPPVVSSTPDTERSELSPPKRETTFIQIDTLHPRNVFGLTTLKFDKHEIDFGEAASVSLVSRGAECVMVSKKLFIAHLDDHTKKWIRHNVRPYPTKGILQENLQQQINWDAYKQKILQDIVTAS